MTEAHVYRDSTGGDDYRREAAGRSRMGQAAAHPATGRRQMGSRADRIGSEDRHEET